MNLKARRQYEMLARANAFGETYAERFPAGTTGRRMLDMLGRSVQDVADHVVTEGSRRGQARGATTMKSSARKTLRKQLAAIRRTARALALDVPGLDVKFRLPRGSSDTRLLSASRTIAEHATQLAAEFVDLGLPSAFLDNLAACVEQFERALQGCTASREARFSALANLKASLESGLVAVRRLDAVVPNVLDGDPLALRQWQKARRLERGRRATRREAGLPRGSRPAETSAVIG